MIDPLDYRMLASTLATSSHQVCNRSIAHTNRGKSLRLVYIVIAYIGVIVAAVASYNIDNPDETSSGDQQQGSWSHWWSYDGISGPDYWNINKHWRLCSLGRKQSPVNIRTDRLLYDHLLGPLHLKWQDERGLQAPTAQPIPSSQSSPSSSSSSSLSNNNQQAKQLAPVRLRLVNSGRGIEVWPDEEDHHRGDQRPPTAAAAAHLHLSRGPLSYEYRLFKLEIHSSSSSSSSTSTQIAAGGGDGQNTAGASRRTATTSSQQVDDDNEEPPPPPPPPLNFDDEIPPEAEAAAAATAAGQTKTSEHLIDGRPFGAELQLHFYNRHLASSHAEAQRLANEQPLASLFAVISVFISLTDDDDNKQQPVGGRVSAELARPTTANRTANEQTSPNDDGDGDSAPLDFVLDNLRNIPNQGDSMELKVDRQELTRLVTDKFNYIAYQGSLNRPPCTETVDWILLNRALRLEARKFRNIFETPNTNQENVRPIKPLNGRLLRTSISFNQHAAATTSSRKFASPSSTKNSLRQSNERLPEVNELPECSPFSGKATMADTDDLYQQFEEVFQQCGSAGLDRGEDGAMDKANLFEDVTDAHYRALMSYRQKRTYTTPESQDDRKKLEVMLREERNTWRLARALLKDQLLGNNEIDQDTDASPMDDSNGRDSNATVDLGMQQNGDNISHKEYFPCSEDQIIGKYYIINDEIRRMQLVSDWLEANEASDLIYKDEEDKVEFHAEGPTAWENTFHAMRSTIIDIPILDITVNPNAGIELCDSMDPDAPFRTGKSLAQQDKEIEIRLFKHLFRFIKAGKLDEGQKMAQRVGYHWLSAILEGWLPYSDPNLDLENQENAVVSQNIDIKPVSGNKRRDVWKLTCFKASKMQGLDSHEKAILGVLGGNIKSVLPVCYTWSDQLWARLKCSIDVKIERALRDESIVPMGSLNLVDLPQDFYESYQSINDTFESIRRQKIVSPFKEATIHQTIQKLLVLGDISGLISQLSTWCSTLDYDTTEGAISPHFLRFFAHIVLFLREVGLISEEDPQGSKIIESYIDLLTQQKAIESVAHYSSFLPKDNQTLSFAKLLATISGYDQRRACLVVARESNLDVDEITQTVVELIRDESPSITYTSGPGGIKTTPFDRRKIDALDYLLILDVKNFIAILHHGNILMRDYALLQNIEALKEIFLKLPMGLAKSVESQWRQTTNSDIPPMLMNNLHELNSFKSLLEVHEEFDQWSDWHHKKPEEPKKPANLTKFCDNVNYEQRLKQYQQDLNLWQGLREVRTNALTDKIGQILLSPNGWMKDISEPAADTNGTLCNEISRIYTQHSSSTTGQDMDGANNVATRRVTRGKTRKEQLTELRRHYIPYLISINFNILKLTERYEDCLRLSHLLASDELKLHEEFSKDQLREFLDKISEVTKMIIKQTFAES